MNVTPGATASSFDATARYEFMVDTDMDARTDRRFEIAFSPLADGGQTATVRLIVEGDNPCALIEDAPVSFTSSPSVTEIDGVAFFAGLRSDPFFVDAAGFFDNLTWTGQDSTATANIFGIVLELPTELLGAERVGLWARVMIPHGDGELQADRAGLPFTNGVFNINDPEEQNVFNQSDPAQDRELFLDRFAAVLHRFGDFTPGQAAGIVAARLPDILAYDGSVESAYPNGRTSTDDVADATWALITNGAATDDGIGPHEDILRHFPWLGPPHAPSTADS